MPSFLAYRPGLMSHLGSILIQIVPGGPAGISTFFSFFFWSPNRPRMVPPGPRGPGGVFSHYFWPTLGALGAPPGGGPGPPLGPYFPYPGELRCGEHLRCNLHWLTRDPGPY